MQKPAEILNVAHDLSMEFGENFLQPVNSRLQEKYPHLQEPELSEYNMICKAVNNAGNDYVYDNITTENGSPRFPDYEKYKTYMLKLYSWISEENLSRLFSQSCYFAMK